MSFQVSSQVSVFIAPSTEQPREERNFSQSEEQENNKKASLCDAITNCLKTVFCCFCCSSKPGVVKEQAPQPPQAPRLQPDSKKTVVPPLNLDEIVLDSHPSQVSVCSDSSRKVQVAVTTTFTLIQPESKESELSPQSLPLLKLMAELGQKPSDKTTDK
jgi:hypothetical protein